MSGALILGGARSGKSVYAEQLVTAMPSPWMYCATAQSFDAEMRTRIIHHRQRRGDGWTTIEEPLDIADITARETQPLLVDCLTLWLTNILLAQRDVTAEIEKLLAATLAAKGPRFFVSNEVGLGIVPEHALARDFRDHAGRLHQALAAISQKVIFMVAGLPMVVKDE